MNILILSDGFSAPAYKPRLRALCEWLHSRGHQIEVFCEQSAPINFPHDYPIREIALYQGGLIDWGLKNIGTMLFNWKEHAFQSQIEKQIAGKSFDIVFCTSFHTFPLRTANRIAAKRRIPVVLDLRDMTEQAPANKFLYLSHHAQWLKPFAHLYLQQNLRRRNNELRRASAITTVSPWHKALIETITCQRKPVSVIYNGYAPQQFEPKDISNSTFRIIYTGKVFPAPQQDPTLLFLALRQLQLPPQKVSVDWYTDPTSEALVRQLALQHGVEQYMQYHGQVAQEHIAPLLHQASVCLVLTSRAGDINGHGKMTTKFFEALGVEKPVLCVESDEECLAQVIRDTHAGLSATYVEEVVHFIQDKYREWEKNGFTRQEVQSDHKQLFSRDVQSRQFEEIFLSLSTKEK